METKKHKSLLEMLDEKVREYKVNKCKTDNKEVYGEE